MKYILFLPFFFLSLFLKINAQNDKAQMIVDAAIKKHGGKKYKNIDLAFDFRERHYTASRKGGTFRYTRSFKDSTGANIEDILTNTGLIRKKNGTEENLDDKKRHAYKESVNSVIYFALLPYGLNDKAVKKSYIGEVKILGQLYHKIKVIFEQDGGGTDFQDEFIYWFHKEKMTMDYLAYLFHVDGGGLRFRVARNVQKVKGMVIADYDNMQPIDKNTKLED
jgi:hypothetical protein